MTLDLNFELVWKIVQNYVTILDVFLKAFAFKIHISGDIVK